MIQIPGTDPQTVANTAIIKTLRKAIDIPFDYFSARIFSELGLPDQQGWDQGDNAVCSDTQYTTQSTCENAGKTWTDLMVFNGVCSDTQYTTQSTCENAGETWTKENIFGVEKSSLKLISSESNTSLTVEDWGYILANGASFSATMRLESITGTLFCGFGFKGINDPRPTSIRSRLLLQIGIDASDTYMRINFESDPVFICDGLNGKPLILKNTWFIFEVIIDPSPDGGTTFGVATLYLNGMLISTNNISSVASGAADNIISIQRWSRSHVSTCYIDNFGITIYKEPNTKLLTPEQMAYNDISIITEGKRRYTVTIPDGIPRKIGDTIKLIANNVGETITLKTFDIAVPKSLFNGLNSIEKFIGFPSEILFTNVIDEGNIYVGQPSVMGTNRIEDKAIIKDKLSQAVQDNIDAKVNKDTCSDNTITDKNACLAVKANTWTPDIGCVYDFGKKTEATCNANSLTHWVNDEIGCVYDEGKKNEADCNANADTHWVNDEIGCIQDFGKKNEPDCNAETNAHWVNDEIGCVYDFGKKNEPDCNADAWTHWVNAACSDGTITDETTCLAVRVNTWTEGHTHGTTLETGTTTGQMTYWNNTTNEWKITDNITVEPNDNIKIVNYSKLGSDAPVIKMKKLTGTTASIQGTNETVTHGLDSTKIISWTTLIQNATTQCVGHHHTYTAGYHFDDWYDNTVFVVHNVDTESANILTKPFIILITYEE